MPAQWRKTSIRVLVALLVVVIVALTVRAILNYTTGKNLESYLAKAKADGVALRTKDLIADCPESDNAARLWKAVEALLDLDVKDKSTMSKALEDSFYGRPRDGELWSKLASIIEKNRRALDLAMEAASRPCLHLDNLNEWAAGAADVPGMPIVKMIHVTKLLAAEALLRADRGEIPQAMEECRSGMRLARLLINQPFLIHALIAVADMKQILAVFGRIASGKDISQEVLASWITELDPQSWRLHFIKVFLVERANSLEVGLRNIRGDAAAMRPSSGSESPASRFWIWLIRPALKSELVWFQKAFEGAGEVSPLPYYKQRGLLMRTSQGLASPPWYYPPWYYRMLGGLSLDFHPVFLKEATLEAVMLTTRAGLACKIYKIKAGRYPESLEALVPDILSEVPIDPFTGKPLVYKIENGELLIYSLGSNQKDDGGRSTFLITPEVIENDDWTWREKLAG